MASLYDSASLVMIPSGYKEGRVYSIKPTPEYGAEEVTNGGFDTDSDWTKASNWTIAGGKAIADGSSQGALTQTLVTPVVGKQYFISYEISNYSSGNIRVYYGGVFTDFVASNGIHSKTITATSTAALFQTSMASAFNGSIDNISVREVISPSGDLEFSRSNDTATRVNSSGLIEKVRTNLILQSQDLTTSWAQNSLPTITANTTIAPDGTLTADTIAASGNASGVYQFPSVNSGSSYAFSIYLKNISSATSITIGCDFTPTGGSLIFNAVTGTITSVGGSVTASSVTNEGNGWYRVFGTYVATGANNTFIIYGGGVMTFAAWGTMLQESDILTPYIPTTTAAVSVGPVANLPRLDYSGGASCPKLLLEGQRTNLALYSEQFNNWTKNELTITANNLVSPDGYTNADTALETASATFHDLLQTISVTSGTTYTLSSFVKAAGRDYCYLFVSDGATPVAVKYNLATGVVLGNALGSAVSSSIVNYVNGWYRCSLVYTAGATNPATIAISSINSPALSLSPYAGDVTKGIAVYGAQMEVGSYPTSYIPTLSAASTRGADLAEKTSATALIGQTEGTIFWEVQIDTPVATAHEQILNIDAGAFGNTIYISKSTSGNITGEMYVSGGSSQASFTLSGISSGNYKIAFAYAQNNTAMFINGVQVGSTDTSCNVPATSRIQLGNGTLGPSTDLTKQALLFPTRLTNAELAALTTI